MKATGGRRHRKRLGDMWRKAPSLTEMTKVDPSPCTTLLPVAD
jgi:hypothetical protein